MKLLLAGAAAFLLCSNTLAAVGLEIQVDARPIPERAREVRTPKPVEAATSAVERVRIDDSSLVFESGARRVILDFAARKKYGVDLAASTYNEGSLFADAGFRSSEIRNREALARAVAAVQPDKAKNAIPLAEHELSIANPREPGRIEAQTDASGTRFRVGEMVVFSFAGKGAALSEADAAGLGRYLRYFKGGHPAALRALQERRMAPAEVGLVSGPFQAVQTTLRVRVIPLGEAPPVSLHGLKKVPLGPHRALPQDVAAAAFQLAQLPRDDIERRIEDTGRRAQALLKEGKVVPGFFATLEYLLQGAPAQTLLRSHREAFAASPELKAVMPALDNAADKEGAEKAAATLADARARAGEETAYILAVFEANHRAALGRPAEATELFVAVLRRNPTIAGAWKDFGDLLFRQYDTPAAWLCWDTGRRITPRFGGFAAINELEQRLVRELPEFF